jgi:cytochrome b
MAGGGVRIWDLPTRLFHWLLVILVALAWWTAEEGMMERHRLAGYLILGLLLFRLLWGLFGASTARFASFVRGPAATWDYVRGRTAAGIGHNPLGALSVLALLGVLVLEALLGLFATDEDGLAPGPLSHHVSFDTARDLGELHHSLFTLVQLLVALHLAAILFYLLFRRHNLLTPMITGTGPGDVPMVAAPLWRFLLAVALAAGATWWIATGP